MCLTELECELCLYPLHGRLRGVPRDVVVAGRPDLDRPVGVFALQRPVDAEHQPLVALVRVCELIFGFRAPGGRHVGTN